MKKVAVNFGCEIFLPGFAVTVLTFFIAGLLFICALSTSITWERTPHPARRPAFSSHLVSTATIQNFGDFSSNSKLRVTLTLGCKPNLPFSLFAALPFTVPI
jgi:hypothetical protein